MPMMRRWPLVAARSGECHDRDGVRRIAAEARLRYYIAMPGLTFQHVMLRCRAIAAQSYFIMPPCRASAEKGASRRRCHRDIRIASRPWLSCRRQPPYHAYDFRSRRDALMRMPMTPARKHFKVENTCRLHYACLCLNSATTCHSFISTI